VRLAGVLTPLAAAATTSYAGGMCVNAVRSLHLVIRYNWQSDTSNPSNVDGIGTISQVSKTGCGHRHSSPLLLRLSCLNM
jgi:hypothetical protein